MQPIRYKDIPQIPEATYASELAKIVNSVEQTVKTSYEREKQRRAVRFAHAKSYGIIRASVEIQSGLSPDYAQGIYAIPATYGGRDAFFERPRPSRTGCDAWSDIRRGVEVFQFPGHSILENESAVNNFD